MFVRRRGPAVPGGAAVLGLVRQLCQIGDDQARVMAHRWVDSPFAVSARRKVLHPKTSGVVDLLAALGQLGDAWPLPLSGPIEVAAYRAAGDALIGTHGRHRLSTAQYLTLMGPAWHAQLVEP